MSGTNYPMMQHYIPEGVNPPIEICLSSECCFVLGLLSDVMWMAVDHSYATVVGHLPGHSLGTVLSLLVIQMLLLSISQDTLVSIVTRWWNWSSVPSRCRKFSIRCVSTSCWTHPTCSMMLTECCFTYGVKLTTHLLLV